MPKSKYNVVVRGCSVDGYRGLVTRGPGHIVAITAGLYPTMLGAARAAERLIQDATDSRSRQP